VLEIAPGAGYLSIELSKLGKYKITGMGEIQRSGAYNRKEFETFISQTEFKDYEIRNSDIGFSIFLKK